MVAQVAQSSGMVGESIFSTVIAASLISILLNSVIMRMFEKWLRPSLDELPTADTQPAAQCA